MALTENKQIDKIEIVANGFIQVREANTIEKNSEKIATTYCRLSFAPGSDVSSMPANVQAIAKAAWTPEVIEAYELLMQEQAAQLPQ
jgi:hypothetical protein